MTFLNCNNHFGIEKSLLFAEQAHLGSWRAHPLIKALLAQPLSHPSLLLGMQRILNAASQADARQPQQLLQQLLMPFVSFVLLQPDAQGDLTHQAFACCVSS